jgi:CubicO group peptidase (beta-lactamase class C family)
MKKFISRLIIALAITVFLTNVAAVAAPAQPNTQVQDDRANHSPRNNKIVEGSLAKKIDDYLNRTVPFGFSGAVLVAQNNQIVLLNGYGLANRERQIPITPDTVFYIGSLTKQFTAAAILKLEMQGKLRVTDTLDKHFENVPLDKAKITIHQLLTHSSGLESFDDIYGSPIQKDEMTRRIMEMKLRSEPGKEYYYSNPGYNLLGIIVENVSRQPYERYLYEHLFSPAGMLSTGYRIPNFTREKLAHGYVVGEDKGSPLDRPWLEDGPSWAIRGAGAILSTPGDLYRWHLALEKDEILSADAKNRMFSQHVKEEGDAYYGYGWMIGKTKRGTKVIEHNGSDNIFFADFRRFIDENTVIIGLTNDVYGANILGEKIPDLVFGRTDIKFPPRIGSKVLPDTVLQKYEGTYLLPSGATINVKLNRNRLMFDPIGQDAVNLLTNVRPPEAEKYDKLTYKTKIILEEFVKGDFTNLKSAIAPVKFDGYKSFLSEFFKPLKDETAPPFGYEVIGTYPLWLSSDKPQATFVRLSNEKNPSVLLLITWENDRIRGRALMRESDYVTMRTPFVARSKNSFVGFHPGLGHLLSINFKIDKKSKETVIEFQTDQGIKIAKRVGSLK